MALKEEKGNGEEVGEFHPASCCISAKKTSLSDPHKTSQCHCAIYATRDMIEQRLLTSKPTIPETEVSTFVSE